MRCEFDFQITELFGKFVLCDHTYRLLLLRLHFALDVICFALLKVVGELLKLAKEFKRFHLVWILIEGSCYKFPFFLHQFESVRKVSDLVHSIRVERVNNKVLLLFLALIEDEINPISEPCNVSLQSLE